ncbi:MAG: (2Fe-2S)-binding protein [Bacteroidales bacterium]|nr:(2Fe-2S)-binding protein [Bacteroidales bacterium]MCF8343113.1 (2Fe-2S)-binding protein [Bacteroidales bacterium]MCF8349640.1 (2Fe-2S)-binding protein [Bacteroidales bacterium]MCF8376081.1 (2Fe-2S)-binding protein [Bacteroidales bacterium]MCF8400386.1 (2Fe-2S)-binding protein [Bacteroidales bacterium]
MSEKVKFTIDGKECVAERGQNLVDAAADNGVYIPSLCHLRDVIPAGSCRICNIKNAGRIMTACTTPVEQGMEIENDISELNDMRKAIVEMLFVEGNHFCPACEKSGNCELQALAYRFQMMVPRYPYEFPIKTPDTQDSRLWIERNRCIKCKRCIRTIKTEDGKNIFAFQERGHKVEINIDHELAAGLSEEKIQEATDNCPVGSILKKGTGFSQPIGTRRFDKEAIGSDIEKVV